MTDALTLDHVTKRFGDHMAVDDVSLRIPRWLRVADAPTTTGG